MRLTQPILFAAMCATLGVLSACSSQPPAPINNAAPNAAAAPVATPIVPQRSTEITPVSLDAANTAVQATPQTAGAATPGTSWCLVRVGATTQIS